MSHIFRAILVLAFLPALTHCGQSTPPAPPPPSQPASQPAAAAPAARSPDTRPASPIVAAARAQIGKTLSYDPAYTPLAYPNGDVPLAQGVCSDVVIRALRTACRLDLQKLVHEDMTQAFAQYPQNWNLKAPDPNIDHRRVLNLRCYFERHGYSLSVSTNQHDYLPGDLVTCTVAGKLPHIMIVSDRQTPDGTPLVIHNIGQGAKEEPRLFDFPLTGHYRLPPKP